jgi:hypothetical protein
MAILAGTPTHMRLVVLMVEVVEVVPEHAVVMHLQELVALVELELVLVYLEPYHTMQAVEVVVDLQTLARAD